MTVRKQPNRYQNVHARILPAEILLLVFKLIRYDILDTETGWYHRKAYRDLLSCQLVCRAWRGPATEVLYCHVTLDSADSIRLFVKAWRAAKGSALRIEGLHLKTWTVQYFRSLNNRPLFRMKRPLAQLEALLASADGPTDLSVGYDSFHRDSGATVVWEDARVPLLQACTSRLRTLHLDGDYDAEAYEFLPIRSHSCLFTSSKFCFLEDLTFSTMSIGYGEAPQFAISVLHLRKLRLHKCHFGYIWLQRFIENMPSLRHLVLRESSCFSNASRDPSLAQIFDQHAARVTRLEYIHITGISRAHDWHSFNTLRTLTVTSSVLYAASSWPLALQELIVHLSLPGHRTATQGELWHEAATLWAAACSLKASSPSLRLLELWGSFGPGGLRTWQAIGLLFRDALSRHGVQLVIYLK